MITFSKKNMFKMRADIKINTVNCKGVMGAGIAKAFKDKYPEMYDDYKNKCLKGEIIIGSLDFFQAHDTLIINFPTKNNYRKPSKYEYIDAGLKKLKMYFQENPHKTICIPALGCRNGGLDWGKVKQIIISMLSSVKADIIVFEPDAEIESDRDVDKL